jgi:hypothetical protein
MPLLDHFHPPLSEERHWESFHGVWAAEIMASLHRGLLPKGYFAEVQIHIGGVEVDVATLEKAASSAAFEEGNGGVAVEVEAPPTTFAMPAVFPDSIEVHVFETSAGPTLVGALEFVSPGNKDRTETRIAFASKCAAYLQQGIGLLVVDVVTDRKANLHDELIELLRLQETFRFPGASRIYCTGYRPYRVEPADGKIDVRCVPLSIGQALPRMPLSLRGGPTVLIDLETTYTDARVRSQL